MDWQKHRDIYCPNYAKLMYEQQKKWENIELATRQAQQKPVLKSKPHLAVVKNPSD